MADALDGRQVALSSLFLYGTLRHPGLLDLVLGGTEVGAAHPAVLEGHAVRWVAGGGYPALAAEPEARAEGLLLTGVGATAKARLDYYELGFGYDLRMMIVETAGRASEALVYYPSAEVALGARWSLDDWVRDWWPVTRHSAAEMMGYFGTLDGDEVARRFPQIMMRAASAARAAGEPFPATLRADFGHQDLEIRDRRKPYAGYFNLEEADLSFRRFDGTMSATVTRAGFVGGDAVTVLPYDPVRDRVMLVEQFRAGPYMRGDPRPWILEPIAGRVDGGETPETCARREALEETGLTIGALEPVSAFYPSPGAVTEFVYAYVGLAELPDNVAGIGGLDEEHEDIRSHVLSFDRLMDLVSSGEVNCGPLVLSAFWLGQNRARLRGLA